MDGKKTYTLTQLTKSIINLISSNLNNKTFLIICEISQLNEKNGHRYLELVDTKNDNVTSKSSGSIWRSTYETIKSKHKEEAKKIIKTGNKVLFPKKL